MLSHCNNLLVVSAFFCDHIYFEVSESSFLRCGNAIEHIRYRKVDIVHLFEDIII